VNLEFLVLKTKKHGPGIRIWNWIKAPLSYRSFVSERRIRRVKFAFYLSYVALFALKKKYELRLNLSVSSLLGGGTVTFKIQLLEP
jgi:hypothetical protein